jgi:hypothetical protein
LSHGAAPPYPASTDAGLAAPPTSDPLVATCATDRVAGQPWRPSDWAAALLSGDRAVLPPGALFCVIDGPTRGRAWCATAVRAELRHLAVDAGVRRRFAPHHLRHAHAVELLHEGIPLPLIQRQLGHAYLSSTGTYLEGISSEEIIGAIHGRKAPMMHASTGLEL